MRLAVINHHGRDPAGSELTLLRYLDLLPKDIQPTVFLFEDGAFADMLRAKYPTVLIPMSLRMAGTTRSSFGFGAIADAFGLIKRLAAALKQHRAEVVLTNSVKAHFIGMLAARLQGLPCIVYMHDVLHGKALALLKILARTCTVGRVACSKLAADSLGLDRTAVLYSPVDVARFVDLPQKSDSRRALGIPDDGLPVVGLVGRIARWKGQDRFVRIAAKVLAEQKAHFVIVGAPLFGCDEAYPQELRTLAVDLGIADYVHFAPWQSDLPQVYAALDIACNCSTEEPFGRTTVEAMASSVPVICYADAGVCETYTDGASGYHISLDDEDAYAGRIVELLAQPSKRLAFGEHARREAQHLDAQHLAPIFARSIRQALEVG